MITNDKDYAAGFRDGEQSEQELRSAALRLVELQKNKRKHQNINLRNQARSLVGEWLEVYSKLCWKEEGNCTIEKMAQGIAKNWESVIGLLIVQLQRQIFESNRELEEELNKGNSTEKESVTIKSPIQFVLLLEKLRAISQSPYHIDTVKKYIRRSKPPHLIAGRPRKKSYKEGPASALLNIRRSTSDTDENIYWFEKHKRSDFTKLTLIESYINRAYWTASKYSLLVDSAPQDISEAFIQKHRPSIEESLKTANQYFLNWHDVPSDMEIILKTKLENTVLNVGDMIEVTDSTVFHKKLGLEKKETNWFEDSAERKKKLIRIYIEYTDKYNLQTLYSKWVYRWYGEVEDIEEIAKSYASRVVFSKIVSMIPSELVIASTAAAEAEYLEFASSTNSKEFTRQYTHEWSKLFSSALMMSGALKDFTSAMSEVMGLDKQGRDPDTKAIHKNFEDEIDNATFMQHDSALAISDLIISELE